MKKLLDLTNWLYGVIVGLSIRNAISNALPNIFTAGFLFSSGPTTSLYGWARVLEILRLVVFLSMIIRFYLGSIKVFEAYETAEVGAAGYVTDFSCGYIHFMMFFTWSLTFGSNYHFHGLSSYLITVGALLIFPLAWLLLHWVTTERGQKSKMKGTITTWALRNFSTLVWVSIVFVMARWIGSVVSAEFFALLLVVLVTFADLRELLKNLPPRVGWGGIIPF